MKYTRKPDPGLSLPSPIVNALTVDVEDYYQVSAFESRIHRDTWNQYPSRVRANTLRLLDLFAKQGVRATFFVLGWVAEQCQGLVQEIRSAGHEVGSHSYWHRLVYEMTVEEFRDDVRRSRDVLQDAMGERVRLYRAPSFSITRESMWALEVLVEEGFEIDSSIFPVRHDRYGVPDADPSIHPIETAAGPIWEMPGSVVRRWGCNVPVAGGGYLRLFPLSWTMSWLRQINQHEGRPFMLYVHPWEIDPSQPRLKRGSLLSRWRHYQQLESTEPKLQSLLGAFTFDTMSEVVSKVPGAPAVPTPLPKVQDPRRLETAENPKPEPNPLTGSRQLPGEHGGRIAP